MKVCTRILQNLAVEEQLKMQFDGEYNHHVWHWYVKGWYETL